MSGVAPTATDQATLLEQGSRVANRDRYRLASYVRALFRDPVTVMALAFLLVIVIAAVAADLIVPHDPYAQPLMSRNIEPMSEAERDLTVTCL